MSNYPPGVTGFEPQIAGFNVREEEIDFECPNPDCDFEGEVEATIQFETFEAFQIVVCPKCGREDEHDVTDKFEPDPDIGRDDFDF